jgi:hypothetical protein
MLEFEQQTGKKTALNNWKAEEFRIPREAK